MAEKPLDRIPPIWETSLVISGAMDLMPFRNAVSPGMSAFCAVPFQGVEGAHHPGDHA